MAMTVATPPVLAPVSPERDVDEEHDEIHTTCEDCDPEGLRAICGTPLGYDWIEADDVAGLFDTRRAGLVAVDGIARYAVDQPADGSVPDRACSEVLPEFGP